tara:strand:- start:981 stop:1232 length:252 start_codon:yes stop_codon:yes gene_type:complete
MATGVIKQSWHPITPLIKKESQYNDQVAFLSVFLGIRRKQARLTIKVTINPVVDRKRCHSFESLLSQGPTFRIGIFSQPGLFA